MKYMITHTAEWILLAIITLLLVFTAYKSYQLKDKIETITVTDTTTLTDTIIVTDKEVVFCEFKAGRNRQSIEQKAFQQQVEQLGYKYWLVYSLDEFIKLTDTL